MRQTSQPNDEVLGRFLRQVWLRDVEPLLRGRRTDQRRKSARVGGRVAATGGLLLDSLFRLRGRPFTRAMSVMGSSLGAMLPDVWDWKWLNSQASSRERKVVAEQVRRRAAELAETEALRLFGLTPAATRDELKRSWHSISLRWHPDKARDEHRRAEHHVRFVAYQAAYDRLVHAYDEGRLPRRTDKPAGRVS